MWLVHLVALSSLTRLTCTTPSRTSAMHLITIATAIGAAVGVALAWQLIRANPGDDSADTESGRRRFIGLVGVIVALANLLLILGEEGMVFGFAHHHCG